MSPGDLLLVLFSNIDTAVYPAHSYSSKTDVRIPITCGTQMDATPVILHTIRAKSSHRNAEVHGQNLGQTRVDGTTDFFFLFFNGLLYGIVPKVKPQSRASGRSVTAYTTTILRESEEQGLAGSDDGWGVTPGYDWNISYERRGKLLLHVKKIKNGTSRA